MSFKFSRRSIALTALVGTALCAVTSAFVWTPSWASGANFTTTMVRGAGVWFAPNGRFYVMGGRTSDLAGSDLLTPNEYDPGANTWTPKVATFPDSQNNNIVAGVLTEAGTPYIYCVGGSAAGATVSTNLVDCNH